MAAVALASCRDRETPLTRSYGGNVVDGQVVMAKGGSPNGVEVSVVGTGMVLTVVRRAGSRSLGFLRTRSCSSAARPTASTRHFVSSRRPLR
jgi:hypothetical protein